MKKILQLIILYSFIFAKVPDYTPIILAQKINDKITIDGVDNEPIWQEITTITEFYQKNPDEGKPASFPTEVKICYDNDYIYLFARLHFSKDYYLDQRLTRRDNYTITDWFTLYVDPNFDRRNGYFFAVNPNGVKVDGILYNDQWDDNSWDAVWEAEAVIDTNYWAVEIKIPISQMRFQNRNVMQWGINFKRNIRSRNEDVYFVMVPKKESGFVSKFAIWKDLKDIPPKNSTEIWPYSVLKYQSLQWDKNDPFKDKNRIKSSIGLDLKKNITNSLNLNLTVYPDFGQVEADPASVNLTVFETYYDEKRPFFIEGSEIFSFGYNGVNNNWNFNWMDPEIFYSRRIGRSPQLSTQKDYDFSNIPNQTNIIFAGKISGKVSDNLSLGLLNAVTERTYGEYKYQDKNFKDEIEPLTNYNVLRLINEFDKGEKGIGVIWTSTNRNLRSDYAKNRLASNSNIIGIDGWLPLDDDGIYAIKSYFVFSDVRGNKNYIEKLQKKSARYYQNPDNYYPVDTNATSLRGYLARIAINKQSGNFYFNTAFGIASPGFEINDLGFLSSVDKINSHLVLGYRWYEPDVIFRSKSIYLAGAINENFSGYLTNKYIGIFANFQFINYYGGKLQYNYGFDVYDPRLTRGGPTVKTKGGYSIEGNIYSDSRNKLIVSTGGSLSLQRDGGKSHNFWFSFDWRINKNLTTSITPSFSKSIDKYHWVDRFEDNSLPELNNTRYIFAQLDNYDISTSLRLDYFFTSTMTLQLFLRPYFSTGEFSNYCYLIEKKTGKYKLFNKNEIIVSERTITLKDNQNDFEIDKPDYKYLSLRSNLIFRWEFTAGSTLYLIWNYQNDENRNYSKINPYNDVSDIMAKKGNNVIQLKVNYWINA